MNEIQTEAYLEGHNLVSLAFCSGTSIDIPTLTGWVNRCLAKDSSIEKTVQLHDRDEEGNLAKTTTLKGNRAELCGYRLLGAFNAVEGMRAALSGKGVTFSQQEKS
jgi:hypothetical protein